MPMGIAPEIRVLRGKFVHVPQPSPALLLEIAHRMVQPLTPHRIYHARNSFPSSMLWPCNNGETASMNNIVYIVGAVVIVVAVLSLLGLR